MCNTNLFDLICCKLIAVRDSDPEPNPPFFSSRIVLATMDYLKKAHNVGAKVSSLVQLLAKSQVVFQLLSASSCRPLVLRNFYPADMYDCLIPCFTLFFVFIA
jgi:hypothetical protein